MSYDLHIVRTEDWLDASEAPIARDELEAVVAADPELTLDESQYVSMSRQGGHANRYPIVLWHGEPAFWWYEDQIICSSPDELLVKKLVEVASKLNAKVIGDEGERYE